MPAEQDFYGDYRPGSTTVRDGDGNVVVLGATIAMSREMLDDCPGQRIENYIAEVFTYGQPRRHRNPLPEIVLFPSLKRATDAAVKVRERAAAVRYAVRHGWPDADRDDW